MIFTLVLVIWSCEKENLSLTGFTTRFEKNSTGTTILEVKSNVRIINLTGRINLTEGMLEIRLLNPDDEAIFSILIHPGHTGTVRESFNAEPGPWKLMYKSMDGLGSMNLHVHMMDDNLQKTICK